MVKRDDVNHQTIQGNKLRKLKYNLKPAIENDINVIATFGGAWSNHIIATAAAANACGLNSIGFIRGDELCDKAHLWSHTLLNAQAQGMKLKFISRSDYRLKFNAAIVQGFIKKQPSPVMCIEEGGSNLLATAGTQEVIDELSQQICHRIDYLLCACGTGGTLAGLIDGVAKYNNIGQIIGIPVLKGAHFLVDQIKQLSAHHQSVNWQLNQHYHAGGYAKTTPDMRRFAQKFRQEQAIDLDQIYTIKTFFAAYDMINKGHIPAGSSVLILHTGGLQAGVIR